MNSKPLSGVGDEATVNGLLKRGADSDVGSFDLAQLFRCESLRATIEKRHSETGAGVYNPVF